MGDLACKTKIILDGSSAAGYAQAIVDTVKSFSDKQTSVLTDEVTYPIIYKMIDAEHALEEAHNMLLDAVGYDGPRP